MHFNNPYKQPINPNFMVLVSGYETIKSHAYYHINFQIQGQDFHMTEGIENPQLALKILRELTAKGYSPQISRTICYDCTRTGFLTKDPEYQDLTIERLEEIVLNNEALPTHEEPTYVPNTRGADIGD